jgi:hypothetical protein
MPYDPATQTRRYSRRYLGGLFLLLMLPVGFAATLDDANLAIRARHYAEAVKILQPLASAGDAEAQY